MNFKIGTPMEHAERYQVPRPAITACEVGFLHVGWPRNLLKEDWLENTKGKRRLQMIEDLYENSSYEV